MPKKKNQETKVSIVKLPAYRSCFDWEEHGMQVRVYGKKKLMAKDVHWALTKARDAVLYRE